MCSMHPVADRPTALHAGSECRTAHPHESRCGLPGLRTLTNRLGSPASTMGLYSKRVVREKVKARIQEKSTVIGCRPRGRQPSIREQSSTGMWRAAELWEGGSAALRSTGLTSMVSRLWWSERTLVEVQEMWWHPHRCARAGPAQGPGLHRCKRELSRWPYIQALATWTITEFPER